MAALITDKLRKYKSLFSTTLSTGIGTGTSDTITPATVTGLPTDTAITLTIDRVDSAGIATPSKLERIKGIISGGNLIDYVRGVDGTTEQSHTAGAVVEMVWNAADLNDIVDWGLIEHGQDGKHTSALVTSLKASGAVVNTGTSDVTIVTPKAIADSKLSYTDGTETLTNKDLTSSTNLISFNSPRGYLINGKIVPSVASNNLTVAIKGLDGNDPSATNPVYCRIGDTIRSITAALSVTKNAGTNWCDSGSSELATKEVDYFVYLGYNATDGVTIGFSRIPFANEYDDFSATSTNDRYCAISTITNAAAGDDYELIGRFAATLSAGAGYTWTVPTFTNKNLIQRPIYETRWLSYTLVPTGFSSNPTATCIYQIIMRYCRGYQYITGAGTSNANTYTVTGPIVSSSVARVLDKVIQAVDNGSNTLAGTTIGQSTKTITLLKGFSSTGWTTSGNKYSSFSFSYDI